MGKLSNTKRKGRTQNAQEKKKPKKLGIVIFMLDMGKNPT